MALTTEGRALTDAHRREQALLGSAIAAQALELGGLIDPTDIPGSLNGWLEAMLGLLAFAHQSGTAKATRYVKSFRAAEVGPAKASRMPLAVPSFDVAAATRACVWAPWTARAAAITGANPQTAWNLVQQALVGRIMREALAPGRETIRGSAQAARHLWRRVSDGNPCAWCAMLVTRGPSYATKDTATKPMSRRARGTHAIHMDRYHDFCGCTAEEFVGDPSDWQPTDREQQYIDLYDQTHRPGMTGSQTAAAMRAKGQGIVHDAHVPKTQSGTGGGKPPKPPRILSASSSGESGDEAYWKRRQDALGIETHGETLEPDEIVFCERFMKAHPGKAPHDVLEWIAKDRYDKDGHRLPTNDFAWIALNGEEWELKTPSTQTGKKSVYDRIKQRIRDDLKKEKTRFMIDLGPDALDDDLKRHLIGYKKKSGCEIAILSKNGASLKIL